MLSHVEMAPAAGAAAGFKLFGKVITQPIHADAAAAAAGDKSRDAPIFRRDAGVEPQQAGAPPLKQEQQDHEMRDGGGDQPPASPRRPAPRPPPQDSAAAAAAAESRAAAAPLPCPRCRSRDTKFCYFNNYNVNQPRHFCKACHRYWTAGGALRNVPVGAGRRKNRPAGPASPSAAAAMAGHRAAAAAGFVLGFPPNTSPAPHSPVYAARPDLDRWAGCDRRF